MMESSRVRRQASIQMQLISARPTGADIDQEVLCLFDNSERRCQTIPRVPKKSRLDCLGQDMERLGM